MNILNTYFKHELINAGFPDELCVEWSLSCCQGDGMAFYGDLSFDDLVNLSQKIYANQKRKQNMLKKLILTIEGYDYDESFEIYRNGFGHHYSHFNTMDLSITAAEDLRFFDDENKGAWYFKTAKKGRYMALWDEFIEDLEQHVRDTSKELASQGYRISEASPYSEEVVYQFDTEHYQVELVRHPSELWYLEYDETLNLCQEILHQGIHYADFFAQVKDRETGMVLGDSYCGFVTYANGDKTFDGIRQSLIREAIEATRGQSGLIARQAKLMHKHLLA